MKSEYSVILSAPRERVFAALTEPEQITRWWGEDSKYWMTDVQHELQPGGIANYGGTFNSNDDVSGSSAGRKFLGTGGTRMEFRAAKKPLSAMNSSRTTAARAYALRTPGLKPKKWLTCIQWGGNAPSRGWALI